MAGFDFSCHEAIKTASRVAVAQEVEWVAHLSEDQWFDSWLLQSACQSVVRQDTELKLLYLFLMSRLARIPVEAPAIND